MTPEEKIRKIEQMGSALAGKPVRTEEDFFRALSPFPDHEYKTRFQNLTFTESLDEALVYSDRHGGPGVILGLEFPDNGKRWVKAPVKSMDDLRQVFLNPEAAKLEATIIGFFSKYSGIEFYRLQYI